MPSYTSDVRDRMSKQMLAAPDGSRHVLAVKAPGIGLKALSDGRWMIIERRSSDAQISVLFERAKAFLGDRGEVIVVAQRIVKDGVESKLTHRHRVSKVVDVREFQPGAESDRQIFWNCADRYLRNEAQTVRNASTLATAAKANPRPAREAKPWTTFLQRLGWIGGSLVVCGLFIYPPSFAVIAFVYESFAMRYGW